MKKIYAILLLTFFSISYGQFSRKAEVPVEITKSDGSTFKALLLAGKDNVSAQQNYLIEAFYDEFQYKLTSNSKRERIDAKDVKSIKFLDDVGDESIGLERLKLKEINAKGELVDKKYVDFAPLLYDGKIKIYGSNVIECDKGGGNCMYGYTKIYIKNKNSDFAIAPVDYDKFSLFNLGSLHEKLFLAFKFAGNNCENFNRYLDDTEKLSKSQKVTAEMKKSALEMWKSSQKESRQLKLNTRQSAQLFGKKMMNLTLSGYITMIREFEKNCK